MGRKELLCKRIHTGPRSDNAIELANSILNENSIWSETRWCLLKIGVKYFPDFSQEHFTPRSESQNELIDGCEDILTSCLCALKLLQSNASDVVLNFNKKNEKKNKQRYGNDTYNKAKEQWK